MESAEINTLCKNILIIITTRKRSFRRLCFYRCVSVHRGVHASKGGACMLPGGHASGGHACFPGGVRGCRGACLVAGGHVWLQGGVHGIGQDTVNERAVRILLECILVNSLIYENFTKLSLQSLDTIIVCFS